MNNVTPINLANKLAMIEMLEGYMTKVREGYVTRCGIVFETKDGKWGTHFAATDDRRVDAAMLLELAMRRLGFEPPRDGR